MVWIECVWGGMVTDASVFPLLKRTNQGRTKKRERNPVLNFEHVFSSILELLVS